MSLTDNTPLSDKDVADLKALLGERPDNATMNANTDLVVFPTADGDLTLAPYFSEATTKVEFSIDGLRVRISLGQATTLAAMLKQLVVHSLMVDVTDGKIDQHKDEDALDFRDTTRAEYGL